MPIKTDTDAELDKLCEEAHKLAQSILVIAINDARGPGAALLGLDLALRTIVTVQRAMYGGDNLTFLAVIAKLRTEQKEKLDQIEGQLLDFTAKILANHSSGEKN
jgi:hypothetical protein